MFGLNYRNVIDPFLKSLRIQVSEFSSLKNGDKAIDVCCGSGTQAEAYSAKGVCTTGIDLDETMINLARKHSKGLMRPPEFILADARNLPYKDASFDYASISLAIHDKDRKLRSEIISEMKRIVKPSGVLLFADFNYPMPSNLYGFSAKTIEFIAGGEHYRNFKDYMKLGGLPKILASNGLEINESQTHRTGIVLITKSINK